MNTPVPLDQLVKRIPLGYSERIWSGKKFGVSRSDFNMGKSTKVYAEELGGSDFVSFNFYFTLKENSMKPCEMPLEKVVMFITESEEAHQS